MQRFANTIATPHAAGGGEVHDIRLALDGCLAAWGYGSPDGLEALISAVVAVGLASDGPRAVLYADQDLDEIRIELAGGTHQAFATATSPSDVPRVPAGLDDVAALSTSCGTTSHGDGSRSGLWARLPIRRSLSAPTPEVGRLGPDPAATIHHRAAARPAPDVAKRAFAVRPAAHATKLSFDAGQLIEHARVALCWSVIELWSAYVGEGGGATKRDLREFLAGSVDVTAFDYDLLALVLNDQFAELGAQHPLPYSDWFSLPSSDT
ncbi:hypothetical protein BH10ACT1_BH10ACT1_25390 [soil metagenome]